MVFRVGHQPHTHLIGLRPQPAAPRSSQSFASVLDEASLSELVGALEKRGIDTTGLKIPAGTSSQIPVTSQGNSQVLATQSAPQAASADTPGAASVTPPATSAATPFAPPAATTTAASAAPATAPAAPFVPEFQQNLEVVSQCGGASPLNPIYFATPATAQWIAQKYGTGEVTTRPFEGQGGPFSADGTEYWITLKNGVQVNAGLLANYYQLAPEAQFPGVADQMIRMQLVSDYGAGAV
jgi:hypothetical protein